MMQTSAAPMATVSYGQPMMQTMAPAAVEYIQQAPMVEYIQQAPRVEYVQQAPMVEYVQQAPTIVERSPVAPRNLLAMGNVVSERVISIDELASMDRYAAAEAVMVQAPREIMVQQPQVVEYIEAAPMVEYVQAAPAVEYIQQSPMVEYIQAAPAVEYIQQNPMVEYIQ